MKIQSTTFFITTIFVVISLVTSICFEYIGLKNTIWQQICLALFSASSVSCVLSYAYYRIEKQKALSRFFFLWTFVYQKTLNVNTLIAHKVQKLSIEEMIVDKTIFMTANLMKKDIQDSIEKLREIEYWQNAPDNTYHTLISINLNIPLINSFICNLAKLEIFANQWRIYELEQSLNTLKSSSLLIEYNGLLNDLRGESESLLSKLDDSINTLIKTRKNKAISWQSLKQEFECSAKEFNHIQ